MRLLSLEINFGANPIRTQTLSKFNSKILCQCCFISEAMVMKFHETSSMALFIRPALYLRGICDMQLLKLMKLYC